MMLSDCCSTKLFRGIEGEVCRTKKSLSKRKVNMPKKCKTGIRLLIIMIFMRNILTHLDNIAYLNLDIS